jgi:hypothetical protein
VNNRGLYKSEKGKEHMAKMREVRDRQEVIEEMLKV